MTPTIKKALRYTLQAVAVFAFVFAMAMSFDANLDGTIGLTLDTAEAQVPIKIEKPVPICMIGSGFVQEKEIFNVCACWQDVAGGPDKFIGWEKECEGRGNACRTTVCNTGSASCYCV